MTGDDDPDDRRTYPWADLGGSPDTALLAHYTALAALRARHRRRCATATSGRSSPTTPPTPWPTAARTDAQAAIVAINRSAAPQAVTIPVAGWLPDGTSLTPALRRGHRLGRRR